MVDRNIVILCIAASIYVSDGYRQLVDPGITRARQSSTFNSYGAYRTIDGYSSRLSMRSESCSHTGMRKSEAWLQLDLGKVYNIKYIKFWYRNDRSNELVSTSRLHGYLLQYYYKIWDACYQDTTPVNQLIPMPSTVECPQQARYVRFYTNTPSPYDGGQVILEICEIEVYGCDQNQYGENCTDCGERCVDCNIVNRCVKCQPGFTGKSCENCDPGYSGRNCEPCLAGWYGYNCSQPCSGNCFDSVDCDRVNGKCLSGCVPGYRGDTCSQPCNNGTYGSSCQSQCSGNCFENESCNNVDGICVKGCNMGWEGIKCLNACQNGSFGKDCKEKCSGHCYSNLQCDRLIGVCPNGCDVGWTGPMCDELSGDLSKTYIPIIAGVTGAIGILGVFIFVLVFVLFRKCRRKDESVYDSVQICGMKDEENPYSGLNMK